MFGVTGLEFHTQRTIDQMQHWLNPESNCKETTDQLETENTKQPDFINFAAKSIEQMKKFLTESKASSNENQPQELSRSSVADS